MEDRHQRVLHKGMTPSRELRAQLSPLVVTDDEFCDESVRRVYNRRGNGGFQTREVASEHDTDSFNNWDDVIVTEFLLFVMMFYHLFEASGTKAEESINMQATHDLIYRWSDVAWYSLLNTTSQLARETSAGALYLSFFGIPARFLFSFFDLPKYAMQLFVRFVLGCTVVAVFCKFARAIGRKFNKDTAMILRVITLSQFHFLFNASRLFSDTFALVLVLVVYESCIEEEFYKAFRWATAATIFFRYKLILLFAPLFYFVYSHGKIKLFGRQEQSMFVVVLQIFFPMMLLEMLGNGIVQGFLQPIIERSSQNLVEDVPQEYWIHRFYWYLSNALARCLLTTILPCCMGFFFDAAMSSVFWIVLILLGACSFIPTRDIGFVTYIVPILNLVAASFMARMRYRGLDSCAYRIIYYCFSALTFVNLYITAIMLASARREYPGWYSLGYILHNHADDAQKTLSVYVDSTCFQTGATSFAQFENWEYNTTNVLSAADLKRFDFILTGIHDSDMYQKLSRFDVSHSLEHIQYGFHNISVEFVSEFPYIWPRLNLLEQVAVFVKKVDF